MPIFGTHDKQGNWSVNFSIDSGVQSFPKGTRVCATIKSKEKILEISRRSANEPPFTLNLSQIVDVQHKEEEGTYDRQKAMNRAAIGGSMLGPLGAIIGGSSTGTKKRFIVITYRPLGSDDLNGISLEITDATNKPISFLEELKKEANII